MKDNIVVLKLANYVRPKVEENKAKNWVLNGKNNSFYQYVIDRFNGSPTNAAIINSYVDLIYGKGLRATNAAQNLADWTKFKAILSRKDLRRIIADFELFGEASMEVIQTNGKKLSSISHVAKNLVVPSIENEDCEIESYFFSKDWSNTTKNPPESIPTFEGKKSKEMYVITPYKAGKNYFSDPDYLAGLPYAEMEEEIANLNINAIKKGLSTGYVINVPNGNSWEDEDKEDFKRDVKRKMTGSTNAGDYIIAFNGVDEKIEVTNFPVNENLHKQWAFLTEESKQQILTSHRATSPSIVGIISSSGFSNTADEMDMAEAQLMKRVIAPKQEQILEALETILVTYGINLDLEFIPLTEPKTDVQPTTTELSTHCGHEYSANDLIALGETEDLDNYDIVDEVEVDYDEVITLASTGTARPNSKSEQDSANVLIRYRYVGNNSPQRDFCQLMMSANKIYRKEDIIQMENKSVNPGWGPNGANTYSIWLYKGGGNCYHKWNRVIYLKRGIKIDVNSPLAKTISTSKARQQGEKVPTNDSKVSIAPINMPKQGFLK
jgi:hypothetical protein